MSCVKKNNSALSVSNAFIVLPQSTDKNTTAYSLILLAQTEGGEGVGGIGNETRRNARQDLKSASAAELDGILL